MHWAGNRAGGVTPSSRDTNRVTTDALPSASRRIYADYVKPAFDRVGGLTLLLLSVPLILVAAVVVLVKLGRPIFFRQARIGRDGEEFELWKLRTMIEDRRKESMSYVGPDRRSVHKSPDDPRVPPAGRTLRAWRLDELPQFWNVVRGDMSLVGPRPEMPAIVAEYDDWQHGRHTVKPGVTGLWQISKHNGELMHQCTDVDLDYVESISFLQDLSILARTPIAMMGRKGY